MRLKCRLQPADHFVQATLPRYHILIGNDWWGGDEEWKVLIKAVAYNPIGRFVK